MRVESGARARAAKGPFLKIMESSDQLAQVFRYHEDTKHHFFRYARSLGYLDWANQPDPFRRFEGAPLIPLPILPPDAPPISPVYDDLYRPGAVRSESVSLPTLSRFFEYALALSAWKQAGDTRWALRINPSSGNLHPTEAYLLIEGLAGLAPTPGLYHYAPKEHGLERRADWSADAFRHLVQEFPPQSFLVGLTSVHWREAWKYGERAFRYCQHDLGHAIGTVRIAAATLGWHALLLNGVADESIERLLGLSRDSDYEGAERECPGCLMLVWPSHEVPETRGNALPLHLDPMLVQASQEQTAWHGKANRLSRDNPVPWELIDMVTAASRKTSSERGSLESDGSLSSSRETQPDVEHDRSRSFAGQIIRQRRSALAFDGKTSISAANFFTMLGRVLPHVDRPVLRRPMPWDAMPWTPAIHLALFVHRVDGLTPGLYLLARDPGKRDLLKGAMHGQFAWTLPAGCPPDLPLFLLQEGDARHLAAQVSCGQEIAGDSAFALGMIAEFDSTLRQQGAWFYRRLFWETGLIGQILYLEAEAAGVRATGIGCFFDDPVHQVLGLKDSALQSLYHFTTGGHVDDPRLMTWLPYKPNAT
jgi:SagB-type dehydrogenase family enzyme